jgi:phosphotransferase system HPr-like phosphotransfer protein
MEMLMLAATAGTPLTIVASGSDAESAVLALAGLFTATFGDD